MNRAVLDTSVLIKGIFELLKSLSEEIYAREKETYNKAREIIRFLEEDPTRRKKCSSRGSELIFKGRDELSSAYSCLLHYRDQRTYCELRMIRDCHQ